MSQPSEQSVLPTSQSLMRVRIPYGSLGYHLEVFYQNELGEPIEYASLMKDLVFIGHFRMEPDRKTMTYHTFNREYPLPASALREGARTLNRILGGEIRVHYNIEEIHEIAQANLLPPSLAT